MIEEFLHHHKRGCPENKGRPCTCGLHKARAKLAALNEITRVARGLVEYRKRNTLNFQLEKADDFIDAFSAGLEKMK